MISVIIPVYNASKYLRQCLDSVLAQTFGDFEIVAVDDGSTDESAAILDEYAARDKRVRVFHRPNRGVSAARNYAIDQATGERLTFVDSDDALHPEALKRQNTVMEDLDADVVCSDYSYDREKLTLGRVEYIWNATQAVKANLHQTKRQNNSVGGKLFRREVIGRGRFTEGIRYEDLDVVYRWLAQARKVVSLTDRLYWYRMHYTNFINTWSRTRADVLDVVECAERWAEANMPDAREAARDRAFGAACNIFLLASRYSAGDPACDRAWRMICDRRGKVLFASGVRAKNRLGALISYLGPRIFALFK